MAKLLKCDLCEEIRDPVDVQGVKVEKDGSVGLCEAHKTNKHLCQSCATAILKSRDVFE